MAVHVEEAGKERLPVLAAVLGRAFVDEPMLRWPLGDHGDVADRFTRCFEYFFDEVGERALVYEAGDAAGAAVWLPPGAWQGANTPSQMHELTADGGARFDAFWKWIESSVAAEPLWHLDSVGVEPALQGRGIGGALIEIGLARARSDGIGALLETGTARNVPYYERFGFCTYEDSDAPDGGPHVWFMRWDP
jgi:ribosomal protein S18 acetylase RimI-like enzyme